MAIISCPVCQHRVSNKAAECPKCKTDLTAATPEKLAAQHRDRMLKQSQSMMNQSMLALLLFLGGFGILYWWQPETGSYNEYVSTAAIALGFIWYVVCRARIIWLKRKK
ncbi:hypothetical protein AAY72_02880 [Alishewanella sp. WH16-1]|uniref:hypothetical protein n=1 Tax=Alishewanella sp. WH16-1 TaxID=1651088 RepID=UPI000708AD15|nr:hypothetical protein [Alishewanella sp. WH16-1]KRS22542.1 hypothetical protein AAY72_02880 [Alishewanella sp. WH16-1]